MRKKTKEELIEEILDIIHSENSGLSIHQRVSEIEKVLNQNKEDEEINLERNELEPMVLIMKETNIVEHDGINYFDIAKRYHELCKESVVRELLNQNKDDDK